MQILKTGYVKLDSISYIEDISKIVSKYPCIVEEEGVDHITISDFNQDMAYEFFDAGYLTEKEYQDCELIDTLKFYI